ncbi:hypothetical protein [Acholeplasma granularum]|uniref:hypothetical protein n=1 Tax=Acholeplasma granularum TaxID=264635 RepID=UPI000471BE8C|nr:hypothetical protein [Acholeplasma granularum]
MTKKLENLLPLVILLFGLLISVTMFLDVLKTNDDQAIMNGLTAIFGGNTYRFGTFIDHNVNFSILNLLAFILPGFMSILLVIGVINHKKTSYIKLIMGLITTTVFVISIILLFQLPSNTTFTRTIINVEYNGTYKAYNLAIGAVFGYVSAILGAVSSVIYSVLQFEK